MGVSGRRGGNMFDHACGNPQRFQLGARPAAAWCWGWGREWPRGIGGCREWVELCEGKVVEVGKFRFRCRVERACKPGAPRVRATHHGRGHGEFIAVYPRGAWVGKRQLRHTNHRVPVEPAARAAPATLEAEVFQPYPCGVAMLSCLQPHRLPSLPASSPVELLVSHSLRWLLAHPGGVFGQISCRRKPRAWDQGRIPVRSANRLLPPRQCLAQRSVPIGRAEAAQFPPRDLRPERPRPRVASSHRR